MDGKTLAEANVAKDRALEQFGHIPGLAGIGITSVGAGYGIKMNLNEALDPQIPLPTEIDGVPVVIGIVGRISKLPAK